MSESEIIASLSNKNDKFDAEKKKIIQQRNAQTQHGNEETADEENIVVLAQSFSPVREASEDVVWHEEIYEIGGKCDDDVSRSFSFLSKNISSFQLSSNEEKLANAITRLTFSFFLKNGLIERLKFQFTIIECTAFN